MKLVFKNNKFAIYDDVLEQSIFEQVWIHAQHENYIVPTQNGNWIKVWRLGDGVPHGSGEYHWSKRPFNNYMDAIGHVFFEIAKNSSDIVGDESNWNELITRTYLYPRNTKLSWHNDAEQYAGALTYYIHPKWGSTWGGELMIAEVPPLHEIRKRPQAGPHLDHEWENEYLLEHGVGQWISPKPNRCVIMAGGVYHAVNRVDADVGDYCRCSSVGFLMRPKNAPSIRVPEEESDLEIKTLDLGVV